MEKFLNTKRLAGKKWGNTTEVLNNTYCPYIKLILQYGGKVILTTSDRNLKNNTSSSHTTTYKTNQ